MLANTNQEPNDASCLFLLSVFTYPIADVINVFRNGHLLDILFWATRRQHRLIKCRREVVESVPDHSRRTSSGLLRCALMSTPERSDKALLKS